MATLTKAHHEWSKRASDERFSSIAAIHAAACSQRKLAGKATINPASLRVVAQESGDLALVGKTGTTASLTEWSFQQLASKAEAPSGYIQRLPAKLAADCLNAGLDRAKDNNRLQLLFSKQNDGLQLRALTTDKYSRIWNSDITERLVQLEEQGPWQPAPEAFDGSRGLYMGDRDMFTFMVDNDRRIFETAPGGGLARGFFAWNSEVGARSFGIMTFWYEFVCGNHRVWGASNIKELRIRHIGAADERAFGELEGALIEYAESSAEEDELKINRAMRFRLGQNKDEVLDAIFRLKIPNLGKGIVEDAYSLAHQRSDWYGDPNTAWGMGGALTEIARDVPFADQRVALERSATKVMDLSV